MQKAIRSKGVYARQANWTFVAPQKRDEYTEAEGEFTFTYSIDSHNKAHLIRCKGPGATLCIPDELGGCELVALEEGACSHLMRVASIQLPQNLKRIAPHAFEGCLALASVQLPDALEEIGNEAFLLCPSLQSVHIPVGVRHIGARLAGARSAARRAQQARIEIDSRNTYLHVDVHGMVYERVPGGLVLVDGSAYSKSVLIVDTQTLAIGVSAFAQNDNIVEALLPEGLIEIGESAFRGCRNLSRVTLPRTLQTIRSGAFACTSITKVRIPESCVLIEPRGLNTGAAIPEADGLSYASTIASIEVDQANASYCMHGGMLCKRIEGSEKLEALMCVREAESVQLDSCVERVAQGAFNGTTHIGTLVLDERVTFPCNCDVLSFAKCDKLILDCAEDSPYGPQFSLQMASDAACSQVLKAASKEGRIDVFAMLQAYDDAVRSTADPAVRACQMLGRLSSPSLLSPDSKADFVSSVSKVLENLVVYFGARRCWEGYRQLFEAGMLAGQAVDNMVTMLSDLGDTAAIANLLDLKHEYFKGMRWDYEL